MDTGFKFHNWLAAAKPGERFEYHRGRSLENAPVGIAGQALAASKARQVLLMCRRYGANDFGYLAVRVSGECPAKIFPVREVKRGAVPGLRIRCARVQVP
jgi:hypothetical protein